MATVAERQAERERRRREAEERKRRKEQAGQQQPDQVTVVGGDPNFQLGGGTFSILGIAENQALGGAQVISDQVQFKNANDQRQFGGIVNQLVGGQPVQQNNQQAGQQPAGPNGQPDNQQAGVAGVQPGQEKPAAEGDGPSDLLKRGAGLADEDDIEVDVNIDAKGGKSRHRNFVNFLATDKVPDSIFGIPVVQDESQYTEKDIEFFRKNPKAAGFYEMGDEEPPAEEPPAEEPPPRMAEGAGVTFDTLLTEDQEAKYQKWRATLPKPLQYEGDYDLRGYWLDPQTVKQGIKDGQHFTDRYKKPNHPTFSTESKYARGAYRARAGRWDKDEFVRPDRMGAYPGASNNPGNIEKHERRSDKTLFAGEDGGGVRPDRFARFDDPVAGLNAMATVLARRANELEARGVPFTIENYVPGYAPKSENDVEKYIGDISRYSGLKRNAALDRRNVDAMAGLLKTVVRFESGYPHSQWFTDDEYRAAAELLQEGAFD